MENNKKLEILGINSFNCRGLRNKTKRQAKFSWLNDYSKGICLLQ